MAGGVHQPHGIVGRGGVEVGGGDVAALGKLALVPAAAGDPLAGLQGADASAHPRQHVGHRRSVAEVDGDERVGCGKVHMTVDQAGRRRPAAQVDHFGGGTDSCPDGLGRPGRDDLAARDGHRLRDAVVRVNCQDRAVDKDEVSGRRRLSMHRR